MKMGKVDNHTVAHYAGNFGTEYPRRKKIQNEFAALVYHGVSGVVSALISYDHVVILTEKVDHASFAFVAPVDTYYRCKHIYPPKL